MSEQRIVRSLVGGPPAAVIFDCDGTLVDTERLAQQSWKRLLREYGYELTEDDLQAMFGSPYPRIYAHLSNRAKVPAADALWSEFAALMFARVDTELHVFADAAATVRAFAAAGVPMAVASSSPRDRLDHTLEASGMGALFQATVAGDEIERGKPEPDIFLAAAEQLGVAASDCVIVEDSPTGVRAALAAGAGVVAVARRPEHRDVLADAHVVLDLLNVGAIRGLAARDDRGARR